MTGSSRRMTFYGAAVVVILLVVATLATQTPMGDLLHPLESAPSETQEPPPGGGLPPQGEEEGMVPIEREEQPESGFSLTNVILLLCFAVVISLFAAMFNFERTRSVRKARGQDFIDEVNHRGKIRDVTAVAVEEALDRLDSGMAADHAIIDCWRTLSTVVVRQGVEEDPARTSTELVEAISDATPAAPADLLELAALYRDARYSGRVATDIDVRRARTCLTAIQEALR